MSAADPRAPFTPAYTGVARALHWIVAVIVLTMLAVALTMVRLPEGPTQNTLYELHKSLGVTLIPIILLRLFWRLTHKPVPLPHDIPLLNRLVAETVHWALYALLIVQPLLGWIGTSAYPAPVTLFGLKLPPIWPENNALSERILGVHRWVGYAIAALVCMHVAGALFHHFVRKDTVLLRMLRG
jgi:cytochrome b561